MIQQLSNKMLQMEAKKLKAVADHVDIDKLYYQIEKMDKDREKVILKQKQKIQSLQNQLINLQAS